MINPCTLVVRGAAGPGRYIVTHAEKAEKAVAPVGSTAHRTAHRGRNESLTRSGLGPFTFVHLARRRRLLRIGSVSVGTPPWCFRKTARRAPPHFLACRVHEFIYDAKLVSQTGGRKLCCAAALCRPGPADPMMPPDRWPLPHPI